MQQPQLNFNQIQAPAINPQLNAQQINLGIDQVQAEFNRQEQGLQANKEQMRANQLAMERSLKTGAERSRMNWESLNELTKFSKTLSDFMTTRHDAWKKNLEAEQINQAFLDGGDPAKNAEFKREEQVLQAGHEATVAASTEYLNRGGLPDVAAELEKRSGWEKYYYAKGLVMNGATGWTSFYNSNKDTPVLFRDGNPENKSADNIISINSAHNSAEYNSVVRALRDQYVTPFAGLNQELLNEYLIKPMRRDMTLQYGEWEAQYAKNEEKNRKIKNTGALQTAIQNANTPDGMANLSATINGQLRDYYLRNNGQWAVANKLLTDNLKTLAPNLSPTEMGALAAIQIEGHTGGKNKTLGDLPGFNAALIASQEAQSQAIARSDRKRQRDLKLLKMEFNKQQLEQGFFEEAQAEDAVRRLVDLGMNASEAKTFIKTKDDFLAAEAKDLVNQALRRGDSYIPESLIRQLDDNYLRRQALEFNASKSKTFGLTESQGDALEKQITSAARDATDLAGAYPAEAAQVASQYAREWIQKWIADNKDNYTPAEMYTAAQQRITRMFDGLDPETGKPIKRFKDSYGNTKVGWDASPFNPDNWSPVSIDVEFKTNVDDAKATVATLVGDGVKNPYATGPIKGTEAELEMIKKKVEETGELPPRSSTPIFNILADQAKNVATWRQIVEAQLKVVHGMEVPTPAEFDLLKGKDGINEQEYNNILNLVSVQPTNNTKFRAAIDLNTVMENASQQGALSDPSDPNSPRIGSFVGGDGDLVAQGQGGKYTLNMSAIPNGYGPTVQAAADKFGIPADILAALIDQESSWRANPPDAGAGALGIAQIVPRWHPDANPGVDPHADIFYAASYLRRLMDNEAKGDLKTAIYMYNAGPGTVLKYGIGASDENKKYYPEIMEKAKQYRRKSYQGGLRSNWQAKVVDSPYNSPDLVSPNIRGRIYQLA